MFRARGLGLGSGFGGFSVKGFLFLEQGMMHVFIRAGRASHRSRSLEARRDLARDL